MLHQVIVFLLISVSRGGFKTQAQYSERDCDFTYSNSVIVIHQDQRALLMKYGELES